MLARARSYVVQMPIAVVGQHGHTATFRVAAALVHGFGLSEEEALPLLEEYSARCQPPWKRADLEHKLKSAACTTSAKPRGHLRDAQQETEPDEPPPRPRKRSGLNMTLPTDPESELVPESLETDPELNPEDLAEARRIAGELVKLQRAGHHSGADDPQAALFAKLIHETGGTVSASTAEPAPKGLTPEQLVRVPPGLRGKALTDFLEADLRSVFGEPPET